MPRLILLALLCAAPLSASVFDLRITKVDPDSNEVEVMYTGATSPFTPATTPQFCYATVYTLVNKPGGGWTTGQREVYTLTPAISNTLSDIWLYSDGLDFTDPSRIIHGVKYGGSATVGRESVAVNAGIWPASNAFAPAPDAGELLVWNEAGLSNHDWFVDANTNTVMGQPRSVANVNPVANDIAWPAGTQDFENMTVGDEFAALTSWVFVDLGGTGDYTIRCVGQGGAPGSTRCLKVHDTDDVDQNRAYTATVSAPSDPAAYRWTFYVNVLESVGASATFPRVTIQHLDNVAQFANAWGIEFRNDGVHLMVTGIGGTAASSLVRAAPYANEWLKLDLQVDFALDIVSLRVDDSASTELPVSLQVGADKAELRWCYRGEGAGNVATMLIDDIGFEGSLVDSPTIAVSTAAGSVAHGAIINVSHLSTLAALGLQIDVDQSGNNNTAVTATVGNAAAAGMLVAEFETVGAVAVPLTLTPGTGTFSTASTDHVVTLIGDDGSGVASFFSFILRVGAAAPPPGGGGDKKDDSSCATGESSSGLLAVALALTAAGLLRRRRPRAI